ncbi:677_t:CDS:2, partial [Racocetra fulgida]
MSTFSMYSQDESHSQDVLQPQNKPYSQIVLDKYSSCYLHMDKPRSQDELHPQDNLYSQDVLNKYNELYTNKLHLNEAETSKSLLLTVPLSSDENTINT